MDHDEMANHNSLGVYLPRDVGYCDDTIFERYYRRDTIQETSYDWEYEDELSFRSDMRAIYNDLSLVILVNGSPELDNLLKNCITGNVELLRNPYILITTAIDFQFAMYLKNGRNRRKTDHERSSGATSLISFTGGPQVNIKVPNCPDCGYDEITKCWYILVSISREPIEMVMLQTKNLLPNPATNPVKFYFAKSSLGSSERSIDAGATNLTGNIIVMSNLDETRPAILDMPVSSSKVSTYGSKMNVHTLGKRG
jgi:hypothetical protein